MLISTFIKKLKKIKVGYAEYDIIFPIDLSHINAEGYIRFDESVIMIDDQLSAGCKKESPKILQTLLHEIVHAVDLECDLKLSEKTTDRVANCLTAMILDNGWLKRDGKPWKK